MNNAISYKGNEADYLLSITAFMQSFLGLLQAFLLDILNVPESISSTVRVVFTAIPILVSLIIVFKRNYKTLLYYYFLVSFIFVATLIIWPDRYLFMKDDFVKFTLAVVIPTGLIVYSIRNIDVMLHCALIVSIASMFIAVAYTFAILRGAYVMENYSMGFAFSLLLPTVVMLMRKEIIWLICAAFMTLMVFAIGSRGALVSIIICAIIRFLAGRGTVHRTVLYLVILIGAYFLFFDTLISSVADILDSVGINSRSLRLLMQEEFLSHDSGRNELNTGAWALINAHPIFGNGVWADRQYLGMYCHNFVLELLIDFGYLFTICLISILVSQFIKIYRRQSLQYKRDMLLLCTAIIVPMMVNGSYLTNFNFSLVIGLVGVYSKQSTFENSL